jgi:hypothetical protein
MAESVEPDGPDEEKGGTAGIRQTPFKLCHRHLSA